MLELLEPVNEGFDFHPLLRLLKRSENDLFNNRRSRKVKKHAA